MTSATFAVFAPVQGYFLPFHDSRDLVYALGHRGTLELPQERMDVAACESVLCGLSTEGNGMGDGEGFTVNGRSMSAGDVVTIDRCGTWRCDSTGWTELAGMEAARFPVADRDICPAIDYAAARAAARERMAARRPRAA